MCMCIHTHTHIYKCNSPAAFTLSSPVNAVLVLPLCDRIIFMSVGRCVWKCKATTLFTDYLHDLTKQKMTQYIQLYNNKQI